mgnify:CR=1 FL=1
MYTIFISLLSIVSAFRIPLYNSESLALPFSSKATVSPGYTVISPEVMAGHPKVEALNIADL